MEWNAQPQSGGFFGEAAGAIGEAAFVGGLLLVALGLFGLYSAATSGGRQGFGKPVVSICIGVALCAFGEV